MVTTEKHGVRRLKLVGGRIVGRTLTSRGKRKGTSIGLPTEIKSSPPSRKRRHKLPEEKKRWSLARLSVRRRESIPNDHAGIPSTATARGKGDNRGGGWMEKGRGDWENNPGPGLALQGALGRGAQPESNLIDFRGRRSQMRRGGAGEKREKCAADLQNRARGSSSKTTPLSRIKMIERQKGRGIAEAVSCTARKG